MCQAQRSLASHSLGPALRRDYERLAPYTVKLRLEKDAQLPAAPQLAFVRALEMEKVVSVYKEMGILRAVFTEETMPCLLLTRRGAVALS